ncbi:hypothetical protein HYG86_01675 [Alkalicella caledoniensis]|uniref:Uncharacterized protein n=1 Tax=Alkalicella caledoniensis TaxID=2731377 RepID=A0A7G9W4F3_ALKCA|nr:hypothetical protein [Alkalicella caledoniensis]QNO13565.1 hypothetical protein HYG86_01675 [Alkalicella caledoniensis]
MSKVMVFEGKRLIPLFILLVLLVTVSVYDSLFSTAEPVSIPGDNVHYVSVEQGKLYPQKQLVIIDNTESWVAFLQNNSISHPDYSFDPNNQVAVITMNFQIQNILTSNDDLGRKVLNVICSEKNAYYKIYILPKDQHVDSKDANWVFYDEKGNRLDQIKIRVNP